MNHPGRPDRAFSVLSLLILRSAVSTHELAAAMIGYAKTIITDGPYWAFQVTEVPTGEQK